MAVSSADVPSRFDLVINDGSNTNGYILYDPWTGGASSDAPEKSVHTYTPAFVPRQNTQGDYGDNQQDFWLTFAQKDWSLGEGQRFQGRTDDGRRKYWVGTNVNNRTPGQMTLQKQSASATAAATILSICPRGATVNEDMVFVTSTNLYEIKSDGSITDKGAHGAGATGALRGALISDGTDVYVGGASKIRKWDGATFTDFSASSADSLLYHNNTLYGLSNTSGDLFSWNSAGTRTSQFQWKQVDAGGRSGQGRLLSWGSKVVIAWTLADRSTELWVYDGTGVSKIASLPPNFFAHDLCELTGVIFIAGGYWRSASTTTFNLRPAVWYYANGASGELWKATDYISSTASQLTVGGMAGVAVLDGGIIWNDAYSGSLMFYDPGTGSISSVATGFTTNQPMISDSSSTFSVFSPNSTSIRYFPDNATTASSGTISSSLADFDSSLTKVFRGIKVDFTSATDGDGGSVDIAYRIGDVDGSYTTLQTGATSGTEYTLSGITGRSISVKVTLNKGSSTAGPIVKRVYVRAVPLAPSFRRDQFHLDCSGRERPGTGESHYITLRDGTSHNKDGLSMRQDLITAWQKQGTLTLTDELGTFTGVIEDVQFTRIRAEEYVATVTTREV